MLFMMILFAKAIVTASVYEIVFSYYEVVIVFGLQF